MSDEPVEDEDSVDEPVWLDDDEPLACGLENPDVCESCQ